MPDWKSQKKDIIAIIDLDKNGNDKYDENGELSRRFKIPTEQEWEEQWELIKTKTQKDLDTSHKTVGAYIYDTLLQTPSQKIRGKLIRTIERKYYKDELNQILKKQEEFHPELRDSNLLEACIEELYPNNEAHRNAIANIALPNCLLRIFYSINVHLKAKNRLLVIVLTKNTHTSIKKQEKYALLR